VCLRRGERVDHFQTVRRRKDGTLIDVPVTISPFTTLPGVLSGLPKWRAILRRKSGPSTNCGRANNPFG